MPTIAPCVVNATRRGGLPGRVAAGPASRVTLAMQAAIGRKAPRPAQRPNGRSAKDASTPRLEGQR